MKNVLYLEIKYETHLPMYPHLSYEEKPLRKDWSPGSLGMTLF